jgi:hypothetical protein
MATKWTLLGQKNGSGDSNGNGIVNVNPTGNGGPFNVTIDNYHNLDLTNDHTTADGGTIIVGEGDSTNHNLGISPAGNAVSLSVVGTTLEFNSRQLSYTTFNSTINAPFNNITNGGLPVNGQCIALLQNSTVAPITIATSDPTKFTLGNIIIDRSADVEIPANGYCLITLVRMGAGLVATISALTPP